MRTLNRMEPYALAISLSALTALFHTCMHYIWTQALAVIHRVRQDLTLVYEETVSTFVNLLIFPCSAYLCSRIYNPAMFHYTTVQARSILAPVVMSHAVKRVKKGTVDIAIVTV